MCRGARIRRAKPRPRPLDGLSVAVVWWSVAHQWQSGSPFFVAYVRVWLIFVDFPARFTRELRCCGPFAIQAALHASAGSFCAGCSECTIKSACLQDPALGPSRASPTEAWFPGAYACDLRTLLVCISGLFPQKVPSGAEGDIPNKARVTRGGTSKARSPRPSRVRANSLPA